jgi:hypothetical protein
MLDSDQIITLICLGVLIVYMYINNRFDKAKDEAFFNGYERGRSVGRAERANSQ